MTVAVIGTCVWAGLDSAWEQEKLEARKMLAEYAIREASHTSGEYHPIPIGTLCQPAFCF